MEGTTYICVYVPKVVIVMGPKLTSVFERGAENGEPFGPHELWEERGNASHAVTGDPVRSSSRLELLMGREREEALTRGLNSIQKARFDPMVFHLERPPGLACVAHEFLGVGVVEIDNGYGLGHGRVGGGRWVVWGGGFEWGPCMRLGEFF